MEFVFVVGGSYKAFYLNQLHKIGKPSIIVFNQDIFYDFNVDLEEGFAGAVSVELIELNKLFNCPIVVYGTMIKNNSKDKCIIVCNYGRINIFDKNCDMYLMVKSRWILIGYKQYYCSKAFATITMGDGDVSTKLRANTIDNYFLLSKKSVTLIKGGKFYRKFNKCCKFILRFFKKVI